MLGDALFEVARIRHLYVGDDLPLLGRERVPLLHPPHVRLVGDASFDQNIDVQKCVLVRLYVPKHIVSASIFHVDRGLDDLLLQRIPLHDWFVVETLLFEATDSSLGTINWREHRVAEHLVLPGGAKVPDVALITLILVVDRLSLQHLDESLSGMIDAESNEGVDVVEALYDGHESAVQHGQLEGVKRWTIWIKALEEEQDDHADGTRVALHEALERRLDELGVVVFRHPAELVLLTLWLLLIESFPERVFLEFTRLFSRRRKRRVVAGSIRTNHDLLLGSRVNLVDTLLDSFENLLFTLNVHHTWHLLMRNI